MSDPRTPEDVHTRIHTPRFLPDMALLNPYTGIDGVRALRGNLHAHSTRSDGMALPQDVVNDYASRGYDFLMLSDHDIYTSEEDLAELDSKGMVLIPGNEVSAGGPHMLHVGVGGYIKPSPRRQEVLSEIVKRGGFAVVNHPNWQQEFDHCSFAQLREWVGYEAMEIYNGVIGRLDGSPYATDKWDRLLSMGRRIWGIANDDSHNPTRDVELGWNMVYAKERTPESIIDALRAGRFYASTGVTISKIAVDGMTIRIETENAQRIVAMGQYGRRLAIADGKSIEFAVPPNADYVRFECWGAGEAFAWTQPFFVEKSADGGPKVDFINNWYVSELVPESAIFQGAKESPKDSKLQWMEMQAGGPKLPDGFLSTREQSRGRHGVVFCWTHIDSPVEGQGHLYLGYDGPVRAWVNGEQVFDGPGTNPARPDKAAVYVSLKKGSNALLVALNTNHGKAWGIFARCEVPKA